MSELSPTFKRNVLAAGATVLVVAAAVLVLLSILGKPGDTTPAGNAASALPGDDANVPDWLHEDGEEPEPDLYASTPPQSPREAVRRLMEGVRMADPNLALSVYLPEVQAGWTPEAREALGEGLLNAAQSQGGIASYEIMETTPDPADSSRLLVYVVTQNQVGGEHDWQIAVREVPGLGFFIVPRNG